MYTHELTPWISPLDGGHPILNPMSDAIQHLMQASLSNSGVNKEKLRHQIAVVKHYLAFIEVKAR